MLEPQYGRGVCEEFLTLRGVLGLLIVKVPSVLVVEVGV
jgi:hypothetical protein